MAFVFIDNQIFKRTLQYYLFYIYTIIGLMSVQTQGGYYSMHIDMEQQQSTNRSLYNVHIDYHQDNRSQIAIVLTDKKSLTNSLLNQDQRSEIKNLDSSIMQQKPIEKQPIIIKSNQSLLPAAINKKVKSGKDEITVYYFNTTKKIVFSKIELNKKFRLNTERDSKVSSKQDLYTNTKQPGIVKIFIPYLVKQYCKFFLNFQPVQVNHQNFVLKLAGMNGEDDPIIDPFSHQEDIIWLFDCGNLVLTRKPKDYDRLKVWQKKISPQMEVLQIIIPFQRQIIEQVEKNKTLNSLKQKLNMYNQLGNIVIVSYTTFSVCEFKKKIGDIVAIDRILQVYRLESSMFEDVNLFMKKQKIESLKQQPMSYQKESRPLNDLQFQVSQNIYSGKLYIQIIGTKIIEKYEGGMVSYLLGNERRVQRSIQTLVGLSCDKTTIKLKFLTKQGCEYCSYQFQSKGQVESFFKSILKVGREYKQNFQKI